jgi:hypothetical protein
MNSATARIATTALLICVGSLALAAAETNPSRQIQSFPAQVQAAARKTQTKSFEDFVAAIHQVETTGRTGRIYGDGRRSLGPLQISRAAWQDALKQDASIGGTYADCKNLAYSVKVMRAYLLQHDSSAFKSGDWETCARLWNSGPTWYAKVRLTNRYWAQVRDHLLRTQAAG